MNFADVRREFLEVPVALIDDPALPSRATMDETALDELGQSILTIGLQQPVVLARRGERFEVIAGHRRTVASRRVGVVKLPAIVYPSPDVALVAVQFAENYFREALKPAEEAIWFAELLEGQCGGDTDALAALVKKRREYVEGRLLLFRGCPDVFAALQDERISIGVAEQLNRVPDTKYRRMLLDQAVRGGASVGLMKSWVAEYLTVIAPATEGLREQPAIVPAAPAPMPDPFACVLCGAANNPVSMRTLQAHDYCQHAVLKPALDLWNRRSDYIRSPRSEQEALNVIRDLLDRFPGIAPAEDAPGS